MNLSIGTTVVALALGVAGSALAGEAKSPIFGSAPTAVLSSGQNRSTIGKGSTADYYGYYGNLYSSTANSYGSYAYNGSVGSGDSYVNYYYYAYLYSSYATTNYYYAYYYASIGY